MCLWVADASAAAPTEFDYGTGDVYDRGDGSCGQVTSVDPWTVAFPLSQYPTLCYSQVWNGHWQARSPDSGTDSCWQSIAWTSTVSCDLLPPEEPATCQDGVKSGDETGIDCGGSCLDDTCTAFCPDGWTNVSDLICASPEVPMVNGACPEDYPQGNLTDQVCIATVPITWADPDYDPDAPPSLENFITYTAETDSTATTTYTDVDNGDGTSTRTETETIVESSTGQYDKTTVTTTTIVYNNTTGDTISKTVVTDTEQEQVADPGEGVYAGDPDGIDGQRVSGSSDGSAINWSPLKTSAETLMTKFPFSVVNDIDGVLDSWIVTPQIPQIDVPMPTIREAPFVMDLSLLDPLAVFFRALLGFIAYLGGAWVVIRTWRG